MNTERCVHIYVCVCAQKLRAAFPVEKGNEHREMCANVCVCTKALRSLLCRKGKWTQRDVCICVCVHKSSAQPSLWKREMNTEIRYAYVCVCVCAGTKALRSLPVHTNSLSGLLCGQGLGRGVCLQQSSLITRERAKGCAHTRAPCSFVWIGNGKECPEPYPYQHYTVT